MDTMAPDETPFIDGDDLQYVLNDDRRFFERHPNRRFRARLATKTERVNIAMHIEMPDDGSSIVSLVCKLGPNHRRIRWWPLVSSIEPEDLSDEHIQQYWNAIDDCREAMVCTAA